MVYTITLNPAIDNILKFDNFKIGLTNRVKESYKYAAGKGIHVSKILTNLKIENKAIYLSGEKDSYFAKDLKKQGIKHLPFLTKGKIRNNFKIIDSKKQTEINGIGLLPTKKVLNEISFFLEEKLKKNDFVVISGSFPKNISFDEIDNICKKIKGKTNNIIFDLSNLDFLIKLIKFKPIFIKPNDVELEKIKEKNISIDQLLKQGVKNIVVSHGEQGCSWYQNKKVRHYKITKKFQVKNLAGAGDSLVGGIVSKLVKEENFKKALEFGIASSVATVCSEKIANIEKIRELNRSFRKWIS